jgi:hypothetical protein
MPYNFLAIHVGQAEIEQNQIRPDRLNSLQSLVSVANLINGVARRWQYDTESLLDGFFVVNEKYPWPLLFHQSRFSTMDARPWLNEDIGDSISLTYRRTRWSPIARVWYISSVESGMGMVQATSFDCCGGFGTCASPRGRQKSNEIIRRIAEHRQVRRRRHAIVLVF